MPAIYNHTTMITGLLAPSKKYSLDYHATTNLAGCLRLLPRYSLASIKYAVLVHYISLIVLTNWGIRTFFSISDKRFLLITSCSIYDCSSYWATGAYNKFIGAPGGTRTHTKLSWQQTDSHCSSHIFWTQECYPPAWAFLCFRTHSTYPP